MIRRWIENYWWVFFLVLLSLLPLLWFRQDYLLYSEESSYINYGFIWDKYLSLWSEHLNNGYTHYFFPFLFPQAPYWKILSSLGFSLVFIQRSFSVLIWGLIVLASSKFFGLFTSNRLLTLIGVCVYLLNPYTGSTIFYTAKIFQLFLMPTVFFLTYRFLKERKIEYLLLNFITIYLFQGIFCNPPQAISTFACLPLAWLYRLSEKGSQKLKSTFYFAALCLVISPIFITNAWIYLQNLTPAELNMALAQNTFEALKTDPVKIAQFRGAWWEGLIGPEGIAYNPNSGFYQNPAVVAISLLIFAFGFLPLVFRKINRPYLFWLVTLTFFFFLTKGTASFGGTFFALIYSKISLLRIFREPWAKFIPLVILATSAVVVIALENLKTSTSKISRLLPAVLVMLVLVRGYPTYTTKVVDHTNKSWKRMDVKIPDYWLEAKKWSEKHPEENIFVLPQPQVSTKDYYFHWYYLNPGNFKGPLPFLLLNSNLQWNNYIDGFWSRSANFSTFINYFHPQAFALLNTKYILAMHDVRPTTLGDLSFPQVKSALKETPSQSFGGGKVEILEPKKPSPGIIYLPASTINYFGAVEDTASSLSLVNSQDYPLIKNNPRPEEVGNPTIVAVDLNERNYQESPFQPESFVEPIPQTRLNPKHFLYRLVLLREYWRETTAASDQDKIDLLLWHSAKRLNELATFQDLKDKEREKIRESLCQKIAQVETILRQFPTPEGKQLP
ncbi:MAG: alpha-(1-_3)-arabinofuranosyltransferase family protein, partial [bacterium]|nr:alpha-(1->3)-arabinofuranosyltransferase family protein [bacterium]